MSSQKAALKAAKAFLDAGDFNKAVIQTQGIVDGDNKNHTAFLFLGFAHEKLGNFEAAEDAINSAVNLKPTDIQGYKGLITLFEKQGNSKLEVYHKTVSQLAQIYADNDDRDQCQNVIDKYELFAKKHGSPSQYRRALQLILPTCSFYETLEGRVSQPSLTYQRILESVEVEEKTWINTQIGERRTRLGAKVDQVTLQVRHEAIAKFDIEKHYTDLIDWTRDDDIRHELEQRLFQRMLDNLTLLPSELKASQRDKVLQMANGMVIIKLQFSPAWKLALDWVDAEGLQDWDPNIFRQYIEFFPEDGLSKVLHAFLDGSSTPWSTKSVSQTDQKEEAVKLSEADQLILFNEGLEDCPESILAHRIVSYAYSQFEEHQSAIEMARKAQVLYRETQKKYAVNLQDSMDGINLILAKALVFYQSPRNHAESRQLYESILERKPTLTPALIGLGLIFEEDEDYGEAVRFLEQAATKDPGNIKVRLELAWCRALDCDMNSGLIELENVLLAIDEQCTPSLTMRSEALYRIAYCKWHSDGSAEARKPKNGPYKYLIAAINANSNYAPAYTLLGIYFQDYGRSKKHARIAFQKAFELSTSELEAARRLAEMFANNAEWDMVELVAQRVVESGKARPAPGSKKKAASWPYGALGVVQMNKQQYGQSIVSFQSALRISQDDYHSWVGLGESYHNAGRYIAATRAFTKAESIDHGLPANQTWFAKYMLANVQKEMGSFDEALLAYEEVLQIKPNELGVLIAMLQTLSENALIKTSQGMFGEAAKLAGRTLELGIRISQHHDEMFNLWKAIGDACSILADVAVHSSEATLDILVSMLQARSFSEELKVLQSLDGIDAQILTSASLVDPSSIADKYLIAAILAHKFSIQASSKDQLAQALAWYNLGWAEHQAYVSGGRLLRSNAKKPQQLLKTALKCFRRAIELEAGNAEFWDALGSASITINPKISQHSFVRSLHLNDQSARTWTNLGALYLSNNENELANEAFTRAQSVDPEYAAAWLGQGLLATLYGNLKEARGLFVHAFDISSSVSSPSKSHFAVAAFDHMLKDPLASQNVINLLQPLLALRQLRSQRPSDIIAVHLFSLIAERAGEYESSVKALEEICDTTEQEFENSESNELLARFAQAKADLARAQLGAHRYEDAISNSDTALDLSSEDDLGPAYTHQRYKWRLSAHVTAGIAHGHLGHTNEAIKMLQAALGESNDAPEVVCMLAQVLWAKGGPEGKEAARSQLFNCVEKHPRYVQAVSLLAIIGLLDGDEDILEAVEDDLKSLRSDDQVDVPDKIKISKIIASIVFSKHDAENELSFEALIADALSEIMLAPSQPQGWIELSQATNDEYAAEMAVQNATRQIPPRGILTAEDVARAYANTERQEDSLRAKMLAPWLVQNHSTSVMSK